MARTSSLNRLYFIALFFRSLLHIASAQSIQLKPCYSWDGRSSDNFPCNPEANVSACCGGGSKCKTNIYCENPSGLQVVGECTDRSWNDPACPWRLSGFTSRSPIDSLLMLSADANRFLMEDRIFSYKANTTTCSDGTLCPKAYPSTAENTTCCDAHQGKEEINYHNNERLPQDYNDLPCKSCRVDHDAMDCSPWFLRLLRKGWLYYTWLCIDHICVCNLQLIGCGSIFGHILLIAIAHTRGNAATTSLSKS